MHSPLSRLPVTWQLIVPSLLGLGLAIAGTGLTLKFSHDLAYEVKRAEIQHEAEEGASIVRHFVEREKTGAMTRDEAQRRAMEAVGAIRFEGGNDVALLGFDGVSLVNANNAMVGQNLMDLLDESGHLVTRAQLEVAMSGKPGFTNFFWKKIGDTVPKLKMSYNIGIPEWQMDVTTGDFADDIDAKLIGGIANLSTILVPSLLGCLALVCLVGRSITRWLGTLSTAIRQIERGNLAVRIPSRKTRDAIGQITEALTALRNAAVDKRRLETEAANRRQIIEAERRSEEMTRSWLQGQQTALVAAVGAALDRLAKGDLSAQLEGEFSRDHAKLRADFNAAAARLKEAMRAITTSTAGLHRGADAIATASGDLARRTERQASSLPDTAAALNLLSDGVKAVTTDASAAATIAAVVHDAAQRSRQIVHQAVEATDEIQNSSQRIATIVAVVDDIAFQTNLLVLNAGVEVERTGDYGKRSGVVPSDVRALAQRSTEAAKAIKDLICASTTQAANGIAFIERASETLRDIIDKIEVMNTLVHKISLSSKKQIASLAEIERAVGDMDQDVHLNAALAERSTAAARALKQDAFHLSTATEWFQIGDASRTGEQNRAFSS